MEKLKNEISREDWVELVRLENKMAELHVKYIKKGFEVSEIAATFGQIYYRELGSHLDEESMKAFNQKLVAGRYSGDYTPSGRHAITTHICFRMASAIHSTIIEMIAKNKNNPSK